MVEMEAEAEGHMLEPNGCVLEPTGCELEAVHMLQIEGDCKDQVLEMETVWAIGHTQKLHKTNTC